MRLARALGAAALAVAVLLPLPGAAAGPWGWLGVRIRDLSEQEMDEISRRHGIQEGYGAVIVDVMKDTPAEAAGLRTGDVVVEVRARPIVDTRTLQRMIASAGVGDVVALTVLRGAEGRRRLRVRLAPMPDTVAAERVAAEFGFLIREPEAQPELGGARPAAAAPAVAIVLRGSGAERVGLRAGDVLLRVDGRPVSTLDAVRAALLEVALERPLALVVRRDEGEVTLTLPAALVR